MRDLLPLLAVLLGLWLLEYLVRRPAGGVVITGSGARRGEVRSLPPSHGSDRGATVFAFPHRSPGIFISATARQGRLSVEKVEARLDTYHRETALLRRAQATLMVHLFLVVPLVWANIGIAPSWKYLLLGIIALHTWTMVAFVHAYRALHRGLRSDPWGAAIPLILAPPAAAAANLSLTKKLFREDHPVALASVLCDDASFRDVARHYVRRAMFPLDRNLESMDPAETPEEHLEALRRIVESRLGSIEDLLRPPERRSDAALAYCPRCLGEFSDPGVGCPECPGVSLAPFDESATARV